MLKIIDLFLKQKDNKPVFYFIICTLAVSVYTLFLVIYDCIKISEFMNNETLVSSKFLMLNIFGIIFGVADLIYFIVILFLQPKNIRSK